MSDTIFALSSGAPPAAIGVIRISGPDAGKALSALAGRQVSPRRASLAKLHGSDGAMLDEALVLWFPGPNTATGEDLAELHCHGGRAVIAAILSWVGQPVRVFVQTLPSAQIAELVATRQFDLGVVELPMSRAGVVVQVSCAVESVEALAGGGYRARTSQGSLTAPSLPGTRNTPALKARSMPA